MNTSVAFNLANSFVKKGEISYKYKKITSKDKEMDKILDDINRHNKKLLKELDNEEKLLEGVEKLASGIDDKDYLEFLKNAIKPSHDSKKELYQVLTKHKLTSGFKEVIEALDDSIDYSEEVMNTIELQISLLDSNFLEEIDKISWH